ncbi:hypothetical protein [Phage DSL-LC05]|nr:hypothetical protein [Phage DSL-LC05]
MAINPNIALAVRGIELQDPLAQYGKVAAIQNAQNQNQLAQLQMQQAQREQESTNALNRAYAEAYNTQTGEIDVNKLRSSLSTGGFGSKLPAVEKGLSELQTARTAQQKGQVELLDSKLKQSRSFLDTLDPASPGAAEAYMQWHRANHADPVIGKALEARGITVDQSMQRIQQLMQTPGGLARLINESKLGTEKFMEMNKPTTQVIDQSGQRQVIQIPGLGGTPTTVGTYADVPLPAAVEAQKSRIGKASASQQVVNVSTEKKYGERFGGLIADQDAAKLAAAEAAPQAAATADRVMDLIGTGKVITGTGANVRLQIAKALNLAGGTDSDKIRNTEVLISSLAETTLGAIKSSNLGAGQGFTNADRDFLEKAKAGQLTYDSKSLTELARLSRLAAEKSAESWNKRVTQIPSSALEGTGISTQPVVVPPRKTSSVMTIPSGAIQALQAGQGTPEQFDAIFGAGSAARVLKGK